MEKFKVDKVAGWEYGKLTKWFCAKKTCNFFNHGCGNIWTPKPSKNFLALFTHSFFVS
jgi:hypothetical protein